jgi:hypothetical protein
MKQESLAHWYFRLNGFMTILNFVLHPRRAGSQRTDADILGVRFPYRAEFPEGAESDDKPFSNAQKPFFLIAEITRGQCKLNGPWTNPAAGNVDAVLAALGVFHPETIPGVAQDLYRNGTSDRATLTSSLMCVGNSRNQELLERLPAVPQRTWAEIIAFVWRRFQAHRRIKTDVEQWDADGQMLWRMSGNGLSTFEGKLRDECQLPAA